MSSALEKGRKNTAAKQLPLWLRPAVPTIRKLLKNGALNQRVYPLVMLCAFIQLISDNLFVNHWFTLLSQNRKTIIHDFSLKINAQVSLYHPVSHNKKAAYRKSDGDCSPPQNYDQIVIIVDYKKQQTLRRMSAASGYSG